MPRFLYPPHPGKAFKIPVSELDSYEKQGGWVAQRKFNGSHMVGHLHQGVLTLWNRQAQPFTYYKLTPEMTQCFLNLNIDPNIEVVFDGELLHTKAKYAGTQQQAVTNTIVVYDLLFYKQPLLNLNFSQRYEILVKLCGKPTQLEPKERGLKVSQVGESNLWLAELFFNEFEFHWYEMYDFDSKTKADLCPEIEGLVLKRAENSYITLGIRPFDVDWIMRVRKQKKKTYMF